EKIVEKKMAYYPNGQLRIANGLEEWSDFCPSNCDRHRVRFLRSNANGMGSKF
ncbi:hypothetical protein NPIL_425501, partial [Nephila pilipes]